jgi:hypothetical protein
MSDDPREAGLGDLFNVVLAEMVVSLPPPEGAPMSFESFRHWLLERARHMTEDFTQPDDDWAPFFFCQDDHGTIMVVSLAEFMQSEETKNAWAYGLGPHLVREMRALTIGAVLSSWKLEVPEKDRERLARLSKEDQLAGAAALGRPSESPNRQEILLVMVAEGGRSETYMAPIKRRRVRPPLLLPWDSEIGLTMTGRMYDSIMEALEEVARG